jgi:hydrogenase maturation protease
MPSGSAGGRTLVLGIGNVLMGDEGVGVEVIRRLQGHSLPEEVECVDGGTGSFALLEPMGRADRIVLVDAALDEAPPGSIRRLTPRFSRDYPRTLTAHDIGLKDLIDAFHLLGEAPEVVLFAVAVRPPDEPRLELSPPVAAAVPELVRRVLAEVERPSGPRRAPIAV